MKSAFSRSVLHADYENHNHFPECASVEELPFTVMLKNASSERAQCQLSGLKLAFLSITVNGKSSTHAHSGKWL